MMVGLNRNMWIYAQLEEFVKEALLIKENENTDITETEKEKRYTISIISTVNPEKDIYSCYRI